MLFRGYNCRSTKIEDVPCWINSYVLPTSYLQPIGLLDPGCWYKFKYLMTSSVDPDLIWIFTVWKGRAYPGSAGQGLTHSFSNLENKFLEADISLPSQLRLSPAPDNSLCAFQNENGLKNHTYSKYFDRQTWANSVDPDQTPQNAASDQDLRCLQLIQ